MLARIRRLQRRRVRLGRRLSTLNAELETLYARYQAPAPDARPDAGFEEDGVKCLCGRPALIVANVRTFSRIDRRCLCSPDCQTAGGVVEVVADGPDAQAIMSAACYCRLRMPGSIADCPVHQDRNVCAVSQDLHSESDQKRHFSASGRRWPATVSQNN